MLNSSKKSCCVFFKVGLMIQDGYIQEFTCLCYFGSQLFISFNWLQIT